MNGKYERFYRVLGVEPGCTWVELKLAYRRLVRVWHPDHRKDSDPDHADDERIKDLNTAYRALSEYYRRHGELPEIEQQPTPSYSGVYSTEQSAESAPRTSRHPASPQVQRWRSAALLLLLGIGLALVYALFISIPDADTKAALEGRSRPDTLSERSPYDDIFVDDTKKDEAANITERSSFMPGSTIGEVIAAQGPPTRIEGDTWHFGASKVYFQNGRVTHWEHEDSDPLNARLSVPAPVPSDVRFFSMGSTKSEVRAAQGPPLIESDTTWDYGASRVYFKDDRVTGWDESPVRPLHIRR